jgi:hypothetical protein
MMTATVDKPIRLWRNFRNLRRARLLHTIGVNRRTSALISRYVRLKSGNDGARLRSVVRWASDPRGAVASSLVVEAVSAFYQHAARRVVDLGERLRSWQPAGRRGTSWGPFRHHTSASPCGVPERSTCC